MWNADKNSILILDTLYNFKNKANLFFHQKMEIFKYCKWKCKVNVIENGLLVGYVEYNII